MSWTDEMLLADGFDEAFIGVANRFGFDCAVATYDKGKCIEILIQRDGMDREEAEEYFDFNTLGAWVGDATPVFVDMSSLEDLGIEEEDELP